MLTDQQKIEIINLYLSGLNAPEIEKKYQLSNSTVLPLLRRRGITIRPKKAWRKYNLNEHIFDEINTEEKAYWLGFIIGDGSVNKAGKQLSIQLKGDDKLHLEKFNKFLSANYKIKSREKNQVYININSEYLIQTITKYSIIHNKTYKEINANNIPQQFLKDYYRGFLDADGCIHHNLETKIYRLNFGCECNNFIQQLKSWIQGQLKSDCGSINIDKSGFTRLSFSGRILVKNLCQLFYSNSKIYLDRKKELADSISL